ncbi:putative Lantibiotic dehydratase domain protein [Sphingobacterium sp. PM2-P1-29]|nr:putative Lantibiotic dehydratase domain protein [Sphingobacterium sp. PM2-P1-29]
MHRRIKPTDFFLVRSPRLSINLLNEINSHNTEKAFWTQAVKILSDPQILDALAIASEDFYNQLSQLINEPYGEKVKKVLPSLYKYLNRMAFRPTPFGKFSSISIGRISNDPTDIVLDKTFTAKYRLDLSVLENIKRKLLNDPKIVEELKFYPNSTLTENIGNYSFIEFIENNDDRSFNWSKVNSTPLLKFLLQQIRNGKTYKEILEILISCGIADLKAKQYINDLISLKILVSELEPITTDDSDSTYDRAIEIANNSDSRLDKLSTTLGQIRKGSTTIQSLLPKMDYREIFGDKPKNIFHVDTKRKTISDNLNKGEVVLITKEIFELINLNSKKTPEDLKSFSKMFTSRYGDREIPLMDALDPEYGIGYGKQAKSTDKDYPLLLGISDGQEDKGPSMNKRFLDYILDKYLDHIDFNKKVLELSPKDFNFLGAIEEDEKFKLPLGFYVIGNLLRMPSTDNKPALKFHLSACGGTSSLPLLTRFAYLDTQLHQNLQRCAREEQMSADQAILAEVVFFPKGKAGNVLTRPSLYSYEIPIGGRASVDYEHTILLADLLIRVVNGRVMLRSQKLNKIILPRLSSAHNFHYGMAIYRFLCDMQFQDNPLNISWDWGVAAKRTFLPRITYKHLILSRAQWNIKTNALSTKPFKDDWDRIQYLRSRFHLPEKVLLIQGDHEMFIDLNHEVGIQVLLKELNKKDIRLAENLYEEFSSPIHNHVGEMFTNEIIIPIHGESVSHADSAYFNVTKDIARTFIPGSEWLYLKVYCGEKESDRIIRGEIKEIVDRLKCDGLIDKWFFIRYHDPEPHLRIRFHLKGNLAASYSEVINVIKESFNPLMEQAKISRLSYDTYERELERYGPTNIETCESIFCLESEVIVYLLSLIKHEGEQLRWKFAMVMIDRLFSVFGFENQEKINLLDLLRNNFLEEFKRIPKLKYKMDQNFRIKRDDISDFFKHTINEDMQINKLIHHYMDKIAVYAEFSKTDKDFQMRPKMIISSLSHMLLNRIFNSQQREQEMIIYHFLSKYLLSIAKK